MFFQNPRNRKGGHEVMELKPIIDFLNQRKSVIEEAISCLERLDADAVGDPTQLARKRRGRKFMDAADRQKVSERMKEYWATRRSGKTRHAGEAY